MFSPAFLGTTVNSTSSALSVKEAIYSLGLEANVKFIVDFGDPDSWDPNTPEILNNIIDGTKDINYFTMTGDYTTTDDGALSHMTRTSSTIFGCLADTLPVSFYRQLSFSNIDSTCITLLSRTAPPSSTFTSPFWNWNNTGGARGSFARIYTNDWFYGHYSGTSYGHSVPIPPAVAAGAPSILVGTGFGNKNYGGGLQVMNDADATLTIGETAVPNYNVQASGNFNLFGIAGTNNNAGSTSQFNAIVMWNRKLSAEEIDKFYKAMQHRFILGDLNSNNTI
jgi:hypothetical protein